MGKNKKEKKKRRKAAAVVRDRHLLYSASVQSTDADIDFFQRVYNSLIKRKGDPEFTTFLFGFENMTVRAEMSLFDIAVWLKENPVLADYTLRTPTESLVTDFKTETHPEGISADLWTEYRSRFEAHFEKFGRTVYEFDFANPTPAEEPSSQFEAIKLFIEGKAVSPYDRLQTAVDNREHAT